LFGARGRNRTGTTLRSRDFKSLAFTSFATRARARRRETACATAAGIIAQSSLKDRSGGRQPRGL
jgi:hypothetical protein